MNYFFSCDWGTSAFRLRLIDKENLSIIAEISNGDGCAETNRRWLEQGRDESLRKDFYLGILSRQLQALKAKTDIDTAGIPLVISGMASSTVGIINLPYKCAPFSVTGSDLCIRTIEADEHISHRIIIVSGANTPDDVMRGEETKLVGCLADGDDSDKIMMLPGTHPKHVYVSNRQVTDFKTYMTGEFFELLSKKSLLALSVKENPHLDTSFTEGVKKGSDSNLLHSSFLVRTNALFGKYTYEQNFYYLSGLLIGSELKDLLHTNAKITLLGGEKLGLLYQKAFAVLGIPIAEIADADDALIKGQFNILKHLA